jgi:hypothetical protein
MFAQKPFPKVCLPPKEIALLDGTNSYASEWPAGYNRSRNFRIGDHTTATALRPHSAHFNALYSAHFNALYSAHFNALYSAHFNALYSAHFNALSS